MTHDEELRKLALEFATTTMAHGESPSNIIATARLYYNFLKGTN